MWGSIKNVRGWDPSPRGRPRYNAQIPGFHTIVWIPRICATVNSAGARPPCCRWREGSLISHVFFYLNPCGPKGVPVPKREFLCPKGSSCGPKGSSCGPKGVSVAQKGVPVAQKGVPVAQRLLWPKREFLWPKRDPVAQKGVPMAQKEVHVALKWVLCPKGSFWGLKREFLVPKGKPEPKRGHCGVLGFLTQRFGPTGLWAKSHWFHLWSTVAKGLLRLKKSDCG